MAAGSSDDQMKMMLDDFNKLQAQLIDLRTQNYEIENKLRKSEAENYNVQEKCAQQEKEIQKLSKLMKFPGFQAITKSKSKKDMVELIEENERLNQQMQRHEDDFKLQNQTLLQEVSRLSSENDALQDQLELTKVASPTVEENQRLEAEITALKKANDEQKQNSSLAVTNDSPGGDSPSDSTHIHTLIDNIQKRLISEVAVNTNCPSVHEADLYDSSNTPSDDTEVTETKDNDTDTGTDNTDTDLKTLLNKYFNELRNSLCNLNTEVITCSSEENKSDTEEVNKIRHQLASVKESSKKEVQQLREEVAKWSEKAKKKQESFFKLQEEKEKMYEEYRKEVEEIKKASSLSDENLKSIIQQKEEALKNAQNGDRTEDLLEQMNLLSKENENLQEELTKWREKQIADNTMKVAELESQLQNFAAQKESFIHQIQKLNNINEDYERNNHGLQKQIDDLKKEVEKISEVAERRKNLLDTNALERQQDIEIHQKKIEDIKGRHNIEMEELVGQKNVEIEDMKSQIGSLKKIKKELDEINKKLRKDLEECNVLNAGLNEKIVSTEKKLGWLERTLSEEQENCRALTEQHEQQMKDMTNTFLKEKDEQETIYRTELQELEKALKVAKGCQQEHDVLVEKLKQTAKDHEIELAIGKKKNDQLIKDLKRQLTSERKRADQLSVKLQDFIQEVKVKQTYDEIFNPESLQMKIATSHRRQDSGSHISNVSSVNENEDSRSMKTSSPVDSTTNLSATASNLNLSGMPSNISGLSDETMDLISRYADLQQEKWMLEERVRHLEETGAAMAEDVMQKSLIIQHYVMEKKSDTPPPGRKVLTLKEKMIDKLKQIGTEELNREMSYKMQRILEETLATNVQLQKDLDLMTSECQQLKSSTTS